MKKSIANMSSKDLVKKLLEEYFPAESFFFYNNYANI